MNITILSRSSLLYSTQSLLRAGRARGHLMSIVNHAECNLMAARAHPEVYFEGLRLEKPDAIIPRIGASVTEHGAAVVRQFELKKVVTVTPSDALLEARDKFRSLQKLGAHGLGVPRSFLVKDTKDFPWLMQVLGFPLIIKLLESTHGNGVILANNEQTAASVIDAFASRRERVLLQEFISEASGEDIRAFVVGNEVVATMRRKATGDEFRSNLHRGATGHIVKLNPEETEAALKAAKILGLDIAGVDMLRSKKGPLIIEVNASPGLEGIETVTGVDVAGKIIDLVEKKVKAARNYQNYQAKLKK